MANSSRKYRSMIYAAVGTIHFYRKDFVPPIEGETYGVIMDKNKVLVARVQEEIQNLFGYELSEQQIGKALVAYGCPAQSVAERPAATHDEAKAA